MAAAQLLRTTAVTDGEDDTIPTQVERRSQDEVNQKVSELVQFLMVKDQKKIPIKRADMLKNIIREYKDAYSEIVNRAGRILQEVLGLQMVEIDTKRHIYILTNNLPRAEGQYLCSDKEKQKMGLLLVVLSFIFMKGNSVKDRGYCPQFGEGHKGEQSRF
ncbi:PREDICTED: non-structural maintenance of chromosomes element 3 homolog [Ficedula albicollis]|uniref:non-structural maintenance of chromosomes element 3 homolog n=1 Tax=Ficedula albicollis TaxID=59894 RepID=UPI00035976D3|nr:PREDICTED: non-structural maintenance of chromosomes element 3 homolog [Ficedula albicollis]